MERKYSTLWRRTLLALALGFCVLGASAQTMSDSQVIDFVKKEQAKGTNQPVSYTHLTLPTKA